MTFRTNDSNRTMADLRQLQEMPLDKKIIMTKQRIRQWVEHYGLDHVYISFSGGKDSTVLLHIAREMYPDIKAVFVDTTLEFPEVRTFALKQDDIETLKPKMNFRETVIRYGYPIFSKEVCETIYGARKWLTALRAKYDNPTDRQTDRQTDRRESAYEWYCRQRDGQKSMPGSLFAQQIYGVSGAETFERHGRCAGSGEEIPSGTMPHYREAAQIFGVYPECHTASKRNEYSELLRYLSKNATAGKSKENLRRTLDKTENKRRRRGSGSGTTGTLQHDQDGGYP